MKIHLTYLHIGTVAVFYLFQETMIKVKYDHNYYTKSICAVLCLLFETLKPSFS